MIVGRDGRTTSAGTSADVISDGDNDNDGDTGMSCTAIWLMRRRSLTTPVECRTGNPRLLSAMTIGMVLAAFALGVVCLVAKLKSSHW